jgi:hypothetical protein
VIEATEADVVAPTVTADDPYALLHQHVGHAEQLPRIVRTRTAQRLLQSCDARALLEDVGFVLLLGRQDGVRQIVADEAGQLFQQLAGEVTLVVDRQTIAEAKLGVVFEERVRPCRTASVAVVCPRRRRQVATVDRRAAGRIGDDHTVAKQLRRQLDVRCFTASVARRR